LMRPRVPAQMLRAQGGRAIVRHGVDPCGLFLPDRVT
jgi:hypothetical protein